jgi:hypothetical protein
MISTGISKKLAVMKSRLKRYNFDDGLTSFVKIGGKYWKSLTTAQKMNYINVMMSITRDNESADPHLGDENFQHAVIGQVGQFIELVGSITSEAYREVDKRKNDIELAFNFPEYTKDHIYKSTGSYSYHKLIQRDSTYQVNPAVEDSRARRYEGVELQDKRIRWKGRAKALPVHPEAKKLVFDQLTLLWYGIETLKKESATRQTELIIEGLAPNTNSGYPDFKTQSKSNITKMYWDWMENTCKPVYQAYLKQFPTRDILTVDMIFDCISYCDRKEIYEPSINFYRTQFDKVRSVFGGTVLFKVLGAMVHAAKSLGYIKDNAATLGYDNPKHWEKGFVSYGGLPIMAQLDWNILFGDILVRMPDIVDGDLKDFTPSQLSNLFGYSGSTGTVDVVGEDIKAYDTGVILEDLLFLMEHPKLGFVMRYLLNWLHKSAVWVGDLRIFDVFFKSGHPWTSDIGSFLHINMAFVIRDYIRSKGKECELLCFTVLSDDSLFWWIGFDLKLAVECLEVYGYKIKESASYIFSRDKIVSFLKVLVGYVFDMNHKVYVGDFQSRYVKLAHSEREIEQDLVNKDKFKADIIGIYKVTGDIEIDSLISKLASFGSEAGAVIMEVLRIIKDTALGQSVIKVILGMRDDERYELYRSDVTAGFRPNHLAKLPVQGLLNPRLSPAAAM